MAATTKPNPPLAKLPSRSRFARRHPHTYLGLHGVVGFVGATLCTWAFFAIADEYPEKAWLARVDSGFTSWLQVHGTETGESIFSVVSLFGSEIIGALLVAAGVVLLVRRDWRHLVMLGVTCGGGAALNVALKDQFQRVRPTFADEFRVTDWSFPSGHAMDSLIGYGLIAYWIARQFPRARWPVATAAAAVVVAIGFSRIYLGVHYLSDIVAGYTAGLIWLWVCVTGYRFAEWQNVGASGKDEA
jgi:membrane-associated phospholipid phosphatase